MGATAGVVLVMLGVLGLYVVWKTDVIQRIMAPGTPTGPTVSPTTQTQPGEPEPRSTLHKPFSQQSLSRMQTQYGGAQ